MSRTKPRSLRDNQTKSSSFGAQADGRNEEQLETSLKVQSGGMTGKHRGGEHNPLERPQASEEEDKVVVDGSSHASQGDLLFRADVGKDSETAQVTARHFVRLPIDRQH